ncbi:MAG: hypothetical protein AAGA30_13830, partial [Planctomycetota bacterium]
MQRDGILNTFVTAIGVCLVCSFLVSSAAVGLKALQEQNADEDKKKNILQAAGFTVEQINEAGGVVDLFEQKVNPIIVKLESGKQEGVEEIVEADPKDKINSVKDAVDSYDQIDVTKKKIAGLFTEFEDKKEDIAGISRKEKWSHVYLIKGEGDS